MSVARLLIRPLLIGLVTLLAGCASLPNQELDDNTGQMAERASSSGGAAALYNELAVAYFQRGQLDVALQQARKALSVEPGSATAHNIMAMIYDRLEDNRLAEHHFLEGIELEPRNSYIRNAYAASLCQQGRYGEADEQFLAALKNPLYQTPEVALTNAAICAQQAGRMEQSEAYLLRALRFNPTFPLALAKMADTKLRVGQYAEARRYLRRYQQVARHTAESLWTGIQIEQRLGDQDALASYRLQLENRFPESEEARQMLESPQR